MEINQKHIKATKLLLEGELTLKETARQVGVCRVTLSEVSNRFQSLQARSEVKNHGILKSRIYWALDKLGMTPMARRGLMKQGRLTGRDFAGQGGRGEE